MPEPKTRHFHSIIESSKARVSAFIPSYISNRLLLAFLELLRSWHRIAGRKNYGHAAGNAEVIRKNHAVRIRKNNGFIEDQHRYEDVSLGLTDMAYAGCEIIALYNVLADWRTHGNSGKRQSPDTTMPGWEENLSSHLASLIRDFEKDGILLSGRFGTSPRALCDYIRQMGLEADLFRLDKKQSRDLDFSSFPADSYLLYYYNNANNIMDQIHTICITRNPEGQYTGHNIRGDRARGPYSSIRQMLSDANQDNAKGIALITISYTNSRNHY